MQKHNVISDNFGGDCGWEEASKRVHLKLGHIDIFCQKASVRSGGQSVFHGTATS